jgi:predicted ATPase/Tfp pilus assembly protein PilF
MDSGFDADILGENLSKDADIIAGLRPFVPEELFTRIINEPQRIAVYGSHRPVTVTFTNFLGIDEIIETLGPENEDSITAILNHHFITMGDVITRFGGTVNRLDAYSVGHRILGLFGALQAHDDDPQRAVHAAVEMNQSLQEVNQTTEEILNSTQVFRDQFDTPPLKQRIGVNSGFVFGANTGSKSRREYTVMGDQVNLTARLMGIAEEGEVLIGHSTARQTEDVFNLVEKEAVKVKGKSEPVRNYAVSGVKEATHWKTRLATSPIVGRDEELTIGRKAVNEAVNGQANVLVISGVSGMGKTRLAEELAWYGDQQGMNLLIGTCLSYGKTMTYHPWAEVLRELFGISTADSSQESRNRIEAVQSGMQAIGESLWTPVIGTVLGLDIPDNEITRDLDPKLRRQRVLDLTVKLLKAKAHSKPLMLVIEDAHWADPASMDLIDYVARNISGQPILFMLPHRPDIDLPEWNAYKHSVNIELEDLSDEHCKEIINTMLGGLQPPDSMNEIILSRGCGNPFFIGEVVRALIDAGALERDTDGNFQVIQDMSEIELPDTIHGVIISRIDRLLASDRNILQVASVIGRVFAYRTLNGVYPYDDLAAALRERLNYLNELGLTEMQLIETELYRFIHLTTREVVYEGLPFQHRRSLHREIGGYIEEVHADTIGEQTSLLAYHYYEGHDWQKAMEYNLTAAQNAQREFANDTAILSGQRALEAAERLGSEVDTSQERLAAHSTLGDVMTLVGRYDEAFEQIELAREIVDSAPHAPSKSRQQAELSRKMADVYERRSEYETAFEWLDKGLQYLEEDEATIEATRIYLLGTGIYRRQGQNDEAFNWCQRSLEFASKIDTREGEQAVGQAYYNLGGIQYRRGDLQSALDYCLQSLEVYQEIDDVVGKARAYTNLGATYSDLGEWKQAMDAYNESLTINQQIGDIQREGFLANNLGNIHLYRGEWDQAAWLFKQSNAIWKRIGSPLPDAVTLSNLAQVQICQEKWDQAEDNLKESQAIFKEIGSDDFMPELERRWAEFYLKRGDPDQAMENINRSIEMATEQDAKLELGTSLRVLGEIHLDQGNYDQAKESLQEARSILEELESDYEAAKTVLLMARLAFARREKFDRKQLEQAYLIFEELEAKAESQETQSLLNKLR